MSYFPWQPGTTTRAASQRPAKAPLSRDKILEAAMRILQAEGIDAVSMRRVAAEFDTGPSSLYAHVTNKDELLQLMFDEMCGTVEPPEPDPARWREQIKDLARAAYRALLAHNDLARAGLATVPTGPNAMRVSNAMLAMMVRAGIPPIVASWALDRIFLYVTSDAYEYSIWRSKVLKAGGDRDAFIEQLFRDLGTFYSELPEETYPDLRKYAAELVTGTGEERFEFGLSMLVDGLDRYITPPPSTE